MRAPLWLYRPLLNWQDIYRWGVANGIVKMLPPEQLHATLATVREPVEWGDLELQDSEIVVPKGHKSIQIFGWSIKALSFGHPEFKQRHEELAERFPTMDHPLLRPHVTLYRGGRLVSSGYEGELVFGPERAEVFEDGKRIKHVKLAEMAL